MRQTQFHGEPHQRSGCRRASPMRNTKVFSSPPGNVPPTANPYWQLIRDCGDPWLTCWPHGMPIRVRYSTFSYWDAPLIGRGSAQPFRDCFSSASAASVTTGSLPKENVSGATIQDLESHIGSTGLVFDKYDLIISGMMKSGGKLQWNNSIW